MDRMPLTAVAALALALGSPLAALAADASPVSPAMVPCSHAVAMMKASMPTDAATSTDVDTTFRAMTAEHARAMMAMAKLEMRCGTDEKTKAAAEREQQRIQNILNTLQIF
ncbi:MAG: hypothetical protein PVSMB8_12680 [Vulcanimicrobiaceae bacterium]